MRLSALSIMTIGKKTGLERHSVENVLFFLHRHDNRPILSGMKKGNDGISVTANYGSCRAGGRNDLRCDRPADAGLSSPVGRGVLSFGLSPAKARQDHRSQPDHPNTGTLESDRDLPDPWD